MEQSLEPPDDVKININRTEKRLLQVMVDGKRQTPKNMSVIIDDVTRSYTGNLLSKMDKKGTFGFRGLLIRTVCTLSPTSAELLKPT